MVGCNRRNQVSKMRNLTNKDCPFERVRFHYFEFAICQPTCFTQYRAELLMNLADIMQKCCYRNSVGLFRC